MNKTKISEVISGGYIIELKESDGNQLIYHAADTFRASIDEDYSKLMNPGIARARMTLRVSQVTADATCKEMFSDLPGNWEEKWLSQNQIIDYCREFPNWLRGEGLGTFFIIKRDENKEIDKNNPSANLALVGVDRNAAGLNIRVADLDWKTIWPSIFSIWIVYPGELIV